MCRAGQCRKCSCVELVNGGYAHVQWWSKLDMACAVVVNVGYDMCSGGQWWICSCVELVNGGYAHV